MKKVLFLMVGIALIAGCSKGTSNNPKDVAEKFWSASKSGDVEKAKKYATKGSSDTLTKEDKTTQEGEYKLGEPKIEGEKVLIPTTLVNEEYTVKLNTVLVLEDGKWRVDVNQTMMSMMGGAMGEMMKALGKGMGAMMKGMGGAMGETMKDMQEGMKDFGEQMGKSMGEKMKEMGHTMEEAGKKMKAKAASVEEDNDDDNDNNNDREEKSSESETKIKTD